MIANFFKKTKPIHAIFIGALFLFFFILSIFILEKPDFSLILLLEKFGVSLLFLVLFFLIRFINRKNNLSGQDSYVLLSLALLFGMFPNTMQMNNIFFAHFVLIFSFRRTYSIQSLKNVKQKVFDSGFWIGIAFFFYAWSALFLILPLIAIIVFKRQEIRNCIILLIGFIAPLLLAFTFHFLIDRLDIYWNKLIFEYSFSINEYSSLQTFVPLLFIALFLLVAIVTTRLKINSLPNDLKPSWNLLIGHLLIATYIILVSPDKMGADFIFAFIPIAVFSANFLQLLNNKIIREVVVYTMSAVAVSAYILQFITIS